MRASGIASSKASGESTAGAGAREAAGQAPDPDHAAMGEALRLAREAQMTVEERNFTVAEAQAADEAFITSASAFVMPVVEIDGVRLGDGAPGKVSRRLREIYLEESRAGAI